MGKREEAYMREVAATRDKRIAWWREARFGMFLHWGLYSLLGRHEWAMNRERIPIKAYEKLAPQWKPKKNAPREWARLARDAGMKYMVLTTKHHEGFCLWGTRQHTWNAVDRGPKRDLVAEYVDAARAEGLRVGFYYSLMDWHHPDGHACARDTDARKRFTDYTQGCVEELMSNYGTIDILWYDVSWPLRSPAQWRSVTMNRMVRELQPDILINNRSQLDEDFGTPEGHVTALEDGRDWEACMTYNGSWGYVDTPDEDWHSNRAVLDMLCTCCAGEGNLLLNVGPKPDGSLPAPAHQRLATLGKWLAKYGEPVYGRVDRCRADWMNTGRFTRKGKTAYYWVKCWPGSELAIGGIHNKVKAVSLLGSQKKLTFRQEPDRLVIRGLPKTCPDRHCQVAVVKLELSSPLRHALGAGCEKVKA